MKRIGTCHFASVDSAIRYYRLQGCGSRVEAALAVAEKLREGEIRIGPPELKLEGERAVLDPVEGRYSIVTDGW